MRRAYLPPPTRKVLDPLGYVFLLPLPLKFEVFQTKEGLVLPRCFGVAEHPVDLLVEGVLQFLQRCERVNTILETKTPHPLAGQWNIPSADARQGCRCSLWILVMGAVVGVSPRPRTDRISYSLSLYRLESLLHSEERSTLLALACIEARDKSK